MYIQVDTRQKPKKHHRLKEAYFKEQGYEIVRSKMLCGDYGLPSKMDIVVDTKQNCSELYSDLIQDHVRFKKECIIAQQCGIQLFVVIENDCGFTTIDDLIRWENPQIVRYLSRVKEARRDHLREPLPPASNYKLIRIMNTMTKLYGVRFIFCEAAHSGECVLSILKGEYNERTKPSPV